MLAIIDRRRKDPPRPLALGRVEMAEKRMLAISGRNIYMAPGTKSNTRHLSRFRSCIICYAMMLCYATVFLWKGAQIHIKAKTSDTENRVEVQVSSDLAPNILNSELSQKNGTSARTDLFFVENGPNPYSKNNQLKMKIGTFLESYVYCLVNLFRMFKKCAKKQMPVVPPFS